MTFALFFLVMLIRIQGEEAGPTVYCYAYVASTFVMWKRTEGMASEFPAVALPAAWFWQSLLG